MGSVSAGTRVKRKRQQRQVLVDLLGGRCVACDAAENLEFDHVFPETKSFVISQKLDYSLEWLLPELQKCQLLCETCHNKKSVYDVGNLPARHGTLYFKTKFRCPCEPCCIAKRNYERNRKKRATKDSPL